MLYFFLYEDAFNNYLSSPESWRVLYYDGELSDLQPSPIPSDEQQLYPTCTLEFSASLTLPPFESAYIESLGLSFDAFRRDAPPEQRQMADAYIELSKQLGVLNKATDPYHQLLGHPCQVQGDLLWECQQGTHHEEDLTDWCLLLQIDTDDDAGMMWGDCGMLYFYISKRALVKRDFSQVFLTMQCC